MKYEADITGFREYLPSICDSPWFLQLCLKVLNSRKFAIWSGSGKPTQHHYGYGGLAAHTLEVAKLCVTNNELLGLRLDNVELVLSALYHDLGKTEDYEPTDEEFENWTSTKHKRLIHHISKSAILWDRNYHELHPSMRFASLGYRDKVTHNILSHHGRREWGSPVMPLTKTAWLLHLCDSISGRMNDADQIDFVHLK